MYLISENGVHLFIIYHRQNVKSSKQVIPPKKKFKTCTKMKFGKNQNGFLDSKTISPTACFYKTEFEIISNQKYRNMKKRMKLCLAGITGIFLSFCTQAYACTRAVYLGPENMVVTGRTMDWREDIRTNLYIFPRGMERAGHDTENTIHWKSKYGSVIAAGYDIGTSDGMNEKGLVANLLYLTESVYSRPGNTRPVMGISIWTQYVLDNFATVDEVVAELKKEAFRIDAPDMPNGARSTMHLAVSDATGNSAIFEYLNGNLVIHVGRQFQIMTNSPSYNQQITLDDYWKQIGGLVMLPGTNRASDRFVRASFYINAITQTPNPHESVAGVFSVMRNVSVPLGISLPDMPNIASTRWRSVSDQKNKIYYFETTLTPNVFWVNLNKMDFTPGAPVRKLSLIDGEIYAGDTAKDFKASKPFAFLFKAI